MKDHILQTQLNTSSDVSQLLVSFSILCLAEILIKNDYFRQILFITFTHQNKCFNKISSNQLHKKSLADFKLSLNISFVLFCLR